MPDEENFHKRHLILTTSATQENYTSPHQGFNKRLRLALRERDQHGQRIKQQLESIQQEHQTIQQERETAGIHGDYGIYIEFESGPDLDLKYDSLEDQGAKIEVVNIRVIEGKTYATVYVPEGKVIRFLKKVEAYLTKQTDNGRPKNGDLIESIENLRRATLKSFWTDIYEFESIPDNQEQWWEIWLRAGDDESHSYIFETFKQISQVHNIQVWDKIQRFPERTIVLAKTTKKKLSQSIILLDCLAELRLSRETSDFFMILLRSEQQQWADDLRNRTTQPNDNAPAVCLLDTGVNNSHPLINPALHDDDCHTYDPAWGIIDQKGHGTEMAGLALYGDLMDPLITQNPIILEHRLESVKMFKDSATHQPELYGEVTKECVARAEIGAPTRKRAICLTISSKENRFQGQPTAWSSGLDQISVGYEEEGNPKRLLLVAAGNLLQLDDIAQYPIKNTLEGIHDPAQSWNALTIGAYTEKRTIDQTVWPGFTPLAPINELCPASTTSVMWGRKWPNKPEVVCEGGNYGKLNDQVDAIDSLQLLTTNSQIMTKLFSVAGDTSAATALASRMSAQVIANYPELWPETIRGLIVHSASWKDAMLKGIDLTTANNDQKNNLLRTYGFGVPDLDRALWSANNALTLIAQDSLVPFREEGSTIKTNQVNFHSLPWPNEILRELGEVEVELRITLSYFIEPNPTHRKYSGKFDYASHGLRFDLIRPTEPFPEFQKRINKIARDEDPEYATDSDGLDWVIGPITRNHGSIHSDIWKGTAADLAEMHTISVVPVTGWWRMRKCLKKWDSVARYSLIVSIRTQEENVDIYTPVLNIIRPAIEVTT